MFREKRREWDVPIPGNKTFKNILRNIAPHGIKCYMQVHFEFKLDKNKSNQRLNKVEMMLCDTGTLRVTKDTMGVTKLR